MAHFRERIACAVAGLAKAALDRAGLTHLNGAAKADPIRQLQAEVRVARYFPDTAARIEDIWWNEISKNAPCK